MEREKTLTLQAEPMNNKIMDHESPNFDACALLKQYGAKSTFEYIDGGNEISF